MQREMEKYAYEEGDHGDEREKLRFEISKHRAHAVAGLNSGVCVAPDEKVWNKTTLSNVIIWSEDDIAQGGMHFEIVKEGRATYLSLPGINPSASLLTSIDSKKV